jgi:hypothetical protein
VLTPVFKLWFRSSEPFIGVYCLDALGVAAHRRPEWSARVAVATAVDGRPMVSLRLQDHLVTIAKEKVSTVSTGTSAP